MEPARKERGIPTKLASGCQGDDVAIVLGIRLVIHTWPWAPATPMRISSRRPLVHQRAKEGIRGLDLLQVSQELLELGRLAQQSATDFDEPVDWT
jgi:hypothetical protein